MRNLEDVNKDYAQLAASLGDSIVKQERLSEIIVKLKADIRELQAEADALNAKEVEGNK